MKIAYLYYDLLNLYGESGNIKIIDKILTENNIEHEIIYLSLNEKLEFEKYNMVYIGSGTEENILIALENLEYYRADIKKYIQANKIVLATGNSVDLFGETIGDVKALNIFDYKVVKGLRKMEEIYTDSEFGKIIGFINNNSYNDCYYNLFDYGFKYNNFYGTYVLGPILVRNPKFLKFFMKLFDKNIKLDIKLELEAYNKFIGNFEKN